MIMLILLLFTITAISVLGLQKTLARKIAWWLSLSVATTTWLIYLISGNAPYLSEKIVETNPLIAIQEALRETPQDADLWTALAKAYLLNDQYQEAIFAYSQALTYGGPKAQFYSGAALAHFEMNHQKYDEIARQLLDKAQSLNSQDPTALMLLATIALTENNYQRAYQLWLSLLDSNQPMIDRARIISNIEMIKPFLNHNRKKEEMDKTPADHDQNDL